VLKAYLAAFDPRIVALTGSTSAVKAVAAQFGAIVAVPGRDGGYTMERLTGTLDIATGEAEQLNALAVLLPRS
jgi:protein SCO1